MTRPRLRWFTTFCLLTSLAAGAGPAREPGTAAFTPATLQSLQSIRGLPDSLLRKRPAVNARGVITFHHAPSGLTNIEDKHGGIELRGISKTEGLAPGREIAITGWVDDSRPIPGVIVDDKGIDLLGMGPLPQGIPLGTDQIRTGELDGRRAIMEAVLFSMKKTTERGSPPWLHLNVMTPSGHMTWLVPWDAERPLPVHLLHSTVRGIGVCEAIFNSRSQRVGMLLLINSLADIKVLQPPPADPFASPSRSLGELMRPGLDAPLSRVRVEGVVLSQQQTAVNLIHLRTDQGAVQVEMVDGSFVAGDRIAVVGYPLLDNKHVVLREAIARRLGKEKPPDPLDMTVAQLMSLGTDSDLVRIRGRILRNGLESANGSLFIESQDRVVEVVLSTAIGPDARATMASELETGTELELTGVVDLQGPMLTTGAVNITDMKLTVRAPNDLKVLRAPPWWTPGRLLVLAGGLAAVLALSSAWVVLLRRRVTAQTVIIGEKISRETRWVERSRIARDIHDDVGSALTQITLLGDLGSRGNGDPQQAGEQFERISKQSREAVRALDAIVWTVNPKNDSLAVTISYLCQMVQDLARDAGIRCRLEIPDEIPVMELGAKVRHNLLLAAKEAVHNVLKHSGASMLRLRLECGPEALRLEVVDDGRGFDNTADKTMRTGFDSMRQRMADIGGVLEISGAPERGTTVAFILPWHALKLALRLPQFRDSFFANIEQPESSQT